jgi:hypothetical protein
MIQKYLIDHFVENAILSLRQKSLYQKPKDDWKELIVKTTYDIQNPFKIFFVFSFCHSKLGPFFIYPLRLFA